jgi:shikimate dehydrogenase
MVMKSIGLIGYPLKHSISPLFQQAALDYLGLNVRYEAWETEPAKLPAVLQGLRQRAKLGVNVTVPYKESVIPLLDELDGLAAEIGAVNTIVNRDGKLIGYNTDAQGFITALRQKGSFEPEGKRVLLLGAGGAARAIGFILVKSGVNSLIIANRTHNRAQGLAAELRKSLGGDVTALPWDYQHLEEELPRCHLVVNCTSMGMKYSPTEGQSPLPAGLIPKGALIYDIVYNPMETPLLAQAKACGARTLGGLAMLVYQGAASFELWTGREAPVDIMFSEAERALQP